MLEEYVCTIIKDVDKGTFGLYQSHIAEGKCKDFVKLREPCMNIIKDGNGKCVCIMYIFLVSDCFISFHDGML